MKAYMYCTKAKPYLVPNGDYEGKTGRWCTMTDKEWDFTSCGDENDIGPEDCALNGFVCFECEINKVEEIDVKSHTTKTLDWKEFKLRTCLDNDAIERYQPRYALYLENVKPIEPMNINHSNKIIKVEKEEDEYDWQEINNGDTIPVCFKKAPQNMCYAWVHNGKEWERCVLISIQPQHLANIANGLKDIEVRKSILNKLKELIK